MKQSRRFLVLPSGQLLLPAFMPDATFGVVRSLDSRDLKECGVDAVVMNAFHLMQRPGSSVITKSGGLHDFAGWTGPIVTDSGGFQAYSLILQNSKWGSITDNGLIFHSTHSGRKFLLTPEKSIQLQLKYGSDLLICLDHCTHTSETFESQDRSVARTIEWARRCKHEFMRRVHRTSKRLTCRPLLFAVVQGGGNYELRRRCAESLMEMEFDGFAYGGYPLDARGNLLVNMLEFTRKLIPPEYAMIALGIGHPSNIRECLRIGYELFDSSMPTRDARKGRLYSLQKDLSQSSQRSTSKTFRYCYIKDRRHVKSKEPVLQDCRCPACSNYSLAYLHHLFKIHDTLYVRLATMHNLYFTTKLVHEEGRLHENRHTGRGH